MSHHDIVNQCKCPNFTPDASSLPNRWIGGLYPRDANSRIGCDEHQTKKSEQVRLLLTSEMANLTFVMKAKMTQVYHVSPLEL